jgi:hypothetical protein
MSLPFTFVTDTSTLCVYDLKALEHRRDDDADWWVWPEAVQVAEVNSGAAAFVDLESDGRFEGTLGDTLGVDSQLRLLLSFPSGKVFIGAAEEVTSEGMEPTCSRGGLLLEKTPGTYVLEMARVGVSTVRLSLAPTQLPPTNSIQKPIKLTYGAA